MEKVTHKARVPIGINDGLCAATRAPREEPPHAQTLTLVPFLPGALSFVPSSRADITEGEVGRNVSCKLEATSQVVSHFGVLDIPVLPWDWFGVPRLCLEPGNVSADSDGVGNGAASKSVIVP